MIANTKYDFGTMVQVAKMYYQSNMNQQGIAKEFGWSRSMVSMILSEAKECGIVEVKIYDPTSNDQTLSERFQKRFGLQDCIVVPTSAVSLPLLTKIVAGQAAGYMAKQLKSHSILGVAWGSTCYEFMEAFSPVSSLVDINVVPLIGGSPSWRSEFQLNEMVRTFAEKVRGFPTFMYAPAVAETLEDKRLYLKSMYMKEISKKWKQLDFAVISAGAPPEYYAGQENQNPFDIQRFLDSPNRPAGDLVARRINYRGAFLDSDYDKRLISIDEESLRNAKKVICIACGKHKVLSIVGALRTNTIDVLITDVETARLVMQVADM